MKKFISLVLVLVLSSLAFFGCDSGLDSESSSAGSADAVSSEKTDTNIKTDGKIKVGLSMSIRDQWLSNLEAAATDKAKELGVELNVQDANNDIAAQLSHVESAAVQGFDAMIVNLVNTDNAQEVLLAAGDDMKVIFVNRRPDESALVEGKSVYVGSTESEAGKIQGDYLSGVFKEQGKTEINCVMLQGTLGAQHATERTAAAKKAFEDNGIKVNYILDDTADWDRSKAMEKFIQFAGKGEDCDAVVCNNDEMALGVIEAMKTLGGVDALVAGIDANSNAIESVEAGDMACTVFQNAIGQGETAIEVAVKMANGETVETLNIIPFELVTIENVEDYKGANKG